jgi:hypothetical protein
LRARQGIGGDGFRGGLRGLGTQSQALIACSLDRRAELREAGFFAAFRVVYVNDEMQLCHEGRRCRVSHYAVSQLGTGAARQQRDQGVAVTTAPGNV